MSEVYEYTIKLIRYLLNGDKPNLPNDINFDCLYSFSKSHGVDNMVYAALYDLKIAVPKAVMEKFEERHMMSVLMDTKQAYELEQIGKTFEEEGIDYLPLKGSVVKYLYPAEYYRQSGDIDILIRAEDEEKIVPIMMKLGYQLDDEHSNHDVHVSYKKPPFIEIEIHRQLIRNCDRSYKFLKSTWNYVELKEGHTYCYQMSNEYLYTHLLAHLCKHLYLGGAGIRLITDLYLMIYKTKLNEDVLSGYLRKAKLTDLNRMVVGLVKKWFDKDYIIDNDVEVLEKIILESGSFGNLEMRSVMTNSNTKSYKIKTFIHRLFPPARVLKGRYAFLEKKPYLLPIMWIYRFFDIGIFERETISTKVAQSFDDSNHDASIERIVKAIRDR